MEEKILKQVEEKLDEMTNESLNIEDLDILGRLIDIHKDLKNEEYWETKKEVMEMNYNRGYDGEYGNYGRRGRDSRGRYTRRGMDSKYRGDDMLEEMQEHYGNYSEGRESINRGNYGAESATIKSLKYMLDSVEEFMMMLKEEAGSQEEVEMIKNTARKISEL